MIKGYTQGANISLLNTIYHKPRKQENGKYDTGSIDIIYKDLDSGEKKLEHIADPEYTYYMVNEGEDFDASYNHFMVEKEKVHPVTCKYRNLKRDIAEKTGNLNFFMENIKNGNMGENDKLFTIPTIFNADMNIEDYYRMRFSQLYRNEPYQIDKLYFDIEVDTIDIEGMPTNGQCPVNAITVVHDGSKTAYTFLLKNPKNPLIEQFQNIKDLSKRAKKFVQDSVGGWKNEIRFGLDQFQYKFLFYDEEINMLHDFFHLINTLKPDIAAAWNIAFDIQYLIERIRMLGYSPEKIICHPDFPVKEAWYYEDKRAAKFEERGDYAQISAYTVYICQMITFASIRKGQRIPGYKLDYIGMIIAKVRKLDYSHITLTLKKLPYLDYYVFVFYNIMDTIVQKCIEEKINDLTFTYNKTIINNTRFCKVYRQTVHLINRGISEFNKMGYVMGNNCNKSNKKVGFAGAFVADPLKVSDKPKIKIGGVPINVLANLNDFDYKALYPSIIDENNMASYTQYGKIILPDQLDPNEDKFNNAYFDRTVWFAEDYISHNRLDFCQRYLNLPGYEQMYDEIFLYFTTIKNPLRGLKHYDPVSGNKYMCRPIINTQKRVMVSVVDNTKQYQRNMVRRQERMKNPYGEQRDNKNKYI